MFEFDLSEDFRKVLGKISKKDPIMAQAIGRKIKEIVARDTVSINSYKNLRHDLKNLKRVHITQWLVMTFEVNVAKNFILFVQIASKDNMYRR